jgi:single-strand DNA-binding protein
MSNLNKALLIGRLTKDPEMRYTPSGTAVTNFSIATNRWSSGADGERKEFTDYHNIVAYNAGKRNLAEIVAQYTRKGALVYIEGRIQTRSWEGQDGQKRRTTEFIANDVQFLDSRSSAPPSDGTARQRPAAASEDSGIPAPDDAPRDVDPDAEDPLLGVSNPWQPNVRASTNPRGAVLRRSEGAEAPAPQGVRVLRREDHLHRLQGDPRACAGSVSDRARSRPAG